MFGLSYNCAMSALSTATLREKEEAAEDAGAVIRIRHGGPPNQRSVDALGKDGGLRLTYKQYRIETIDWLEAKGIRGFKELMSAVIKDLGR
ncbi:hypothetical protein LTS18_014888 [Coniosporium uncinatum]|uniref:Uncharacterized protein n=1 Tax=Coniosporium uncinatum TaxID=93489 RepID=A0ACC3DGX8_9PEZI|nr:hypothetical protein LTS18_014888 [Coniosporium uncinatum]